MSYVAIYRKFRPQTFSQVKGQDSIVRTLKNQIVNGRIGHAYLFTGTRGTGKTSVARIFAKSINCLHPKNGEPCNECEHCKAISAGSFMDVTEIDAASNTGVDDIRRVIGEVQYTPVMGKYKVYIIDEVHMLSTSASNAFLKTLEEPPEYAIFILATTEPHKLPVTILSRCQRYDFKRITTAEISENIFEYLSQEHIEAEEKAVQYIARIGDGSMRDSLSLLDKAIAFNLGKKLTYEDTLSALGTVDTETFSRIFRAVIRADAYTAVSALDNEVKNGKDLGRFINDFVWYIRNLLLLSIGNEKEADMLGLSDENLKVLKEDARLAPAETLMRYIRILSELSNQLKFSNVKQVLADVAIIKLARPQMETDRESILDRIRQLENGMRGMPIQTAIPPAPVVAPVREPEPSSPLPPEEAEPVYYEPDYPEMVSDYNALFDSPAMPEPVSAAAPEVQPSPMPQERPAPQERPVPQQSLAPQERLASQQSPAPQERPAPQQSPAAAGQPSQIVCANWQTVVSQCTSPLLKVYLKDTRPEAADDKTVHVYVTSDMALKRLELKQEELVADIRSLLGCDVTIRLYAGAPQQSAATSEAAWQSAATSEAAWQSAATPEAAWQSAAAPEVMQQSAPPAFMPYPQMQEEPPEMPAQNAAFEEQQTEEQQIEALLEKNIKMKIETEDM